MKYIIEGYDDHAFPLHQTDCMFGTFESKGEAEDFLRARGFANNGVDESCGEWYDPLDSYFRLRVYPLLSIDDFIERRHDLAKHLNRELTPSA